MERVGSRLSLIGTVHVDPASAASVRDTIVGMKPEVVALELDAARLMALENPKAQSGRGAGVSFLTMALLERFAGQMTGSPPGTEMLEAARSLVVLPFSRINWSKVTEDMDSQIGAFRKRYPVLSKILIDTREEYMISRLKGVMDSTTGQVLAVVGFGHRASLARALAGYMEGPGFATSFSWQVSTGS